MNLTRIAVTGAGGYIGRHIVAQLAGRAVSMSRHRERTTGEWAKFDLSDPSPELPGGIHAVIHLAADIRFELTSDQELANLRGLIAACEKRGARLVYVSSQSAKHPLGEYGKRKAAAEKLVLDARGIVVRPGLVVGGRRSKGLAAQLVALSRMPILPDLGPRAQVQPIHVDVLSAALVKTAEAGSSGVIELAGKAMTLRQLIAQFGESLRGGAPVFVRMPAGLVEYFCGKAQRGMRASLRQMLNLNLIEDDLSSMGLSHVDLRALAFPSSRPLRRSLASEALALLKQVGCARPPIGLLTRYVRAIEQDDRPAPVDRRPLRRIGPAAIFARRQHSDLDELRRRMDLAFALFEFTPQGAQAGMRFRNVSWLGAMLRLAALAPAAVLDVLCVASSSRKVK